MVTALVATAVTRAADDGTSPDGLIPLTCNEIQHLFTAPLPPRRGAPAELA
ncbi:hypothetical protein ABT009_43195 [Streptomyces sp. NPDC002896]|uniref:hypothetical protein n=1 Tax=Streptomyces sp. NPDC002896 TaxID=3154438 RepID=UPI003319426A